MSNCCNGTGWTNNWNNPCCPPIGTPIDPTQEPLQSEVDNFVLSVYGYVTKTLDDQGTVVWTLPCDLDAGLPDNPRNVGEGMFCYFLRLFTDGIEGAVGPAGPPGADGPPGESAFTTVIQEFVNPTVDAPLFTFSVESTAWIPDQIILFIENLGWAQVQATSGQQVMAILLSPISSPPATVPVGAGVTPTGPIGAGGGAPGTVVTPAFLPVAGIYGSTQVVTITSGTPGATIYYTIDGSPPTVASAVYTVPLSIAQNTTLKAFATKSGLLDSAVNTGVYGIQVATPVASPGAGSYVGAQSVTLTCATSGSTIRYTVDGSTPSDTIGTVYSGAFSVASSLTLKAIAYKTGYTNSNILTAAYVIGTTFSIYYGYSPLTVLDEAGILALSNAPDAATAIVATITGSLTIGSGAGVSDYHFIWYDDDLNDPVATTGIKITSSGFPQAMATSGEGYTSTVNGWGYLPRTVSGKAGKLFRTFFQPGSGTDYTITGD
jgi:hypothetical protein